MVLQVIGVLCSNNLLELAQFMQYKGITCHGVAQWQYIETAD